MLKGYKHIEDRFGYTIWGRLCFGGYAITKTGETELLYTPPTYSEAFSVLINTAYIDMQTEAKEHGLTLEKGGYFNYVPVLQG